ncbi:transposase [Flammeovirga pectinis]|uniref:Transposase n=1 Tax=Flammeovirga pectinis TaxID=2494373 RepID=A0A3S9NZ19_9BACT|nr:transposase [Flammeovirga pectinis]AZQ61174.1 transposase [Flammeovirga pectinis]
MESRAFIGPILSKMSDLRKSKVNFLTECFILFLSIKGKINFLQLSRYGSYSEKTYRNNFESGFSFSEFNHHLINEHCGDEKIIAFDPVYLSKSGKKTYGLGKYWSGCAGKAQKGLDLSGIGIVDVESRNAFHYDAIQTPSITELKEKGMSLVDHYASTLLTHKEQLLTHSKYVVADAYFAKEKFVRPLDEAGFTVISRFRGDMNARYLFEGPKTGKRGRPKKFNGKVDWKNIDLDIFQLEDDTDLYYLYSAKLYSVALKREVMIALVQFKNQKLKQKIFFSTDLNQEAFQIFNYYRLRFHIEFLFRDAKQHTSLTGCQGISKNKIHFHTNMALTSVSIAKAFHWINQEKKERGPFSMANIKTLYFNELILKKIFSVFRIDVDVEKNKQQFEMIRKLGQIAA